MICRVPEEVQEEAEAALEAAPAEVVSAAVASEAVRVPVAALEVRVPEVSVVHLIARITIIITVPISVGDSVRAVITAVAAEDASAH